MLLWHERLSAKIVGIGLVFFAVMALSIYAYYDALRDELVSASRKDAARLAQSLVASFNTFILNTPQGGAIIGEYVDNVNTGLQGARARMVRGDSINRQYGIHPDGSPMSPEEEASLKDGARRTWESAEYFHQVNPVKSEKGCGSCHAMADGSGRPVPDGATLGLIVVSVSNAGMKASLANLKEESFKILALMALLIFMIAAYINFRVARPLEKVLSAMREVTLGKLEERVDIRQKDEIGKLAENFNHMAGQMERSFRRIENWNVELGAEVERKTDEIRKMRDYYHAVIDSTQRIILTTGLDFLVDSVNAEWDKQAEKLGVSLRRDDLTGRDIISLLPEGDREMMREVCRGIAGRGSEATDGLYKREYELTIGGARKYFSLSISPLLDSAWAVVGLVFVVVDITDRKEAEELLKVERNKLNAIMNGMGASVCIVDSSHRITFMNRVMRDTFGEAAYGAPCYSVVSTFKEPCAGCETGKMEGVVNMEVKGPNGRSYLLTHSPITDMDGKRSIVEVIEDITYLKDMEERLRELTITDNLTQLYNKRHFIDRLADEMTRAQRVGAPLSLLFADIDKFKSFNDTYGHVEGDQLLAALGGIIRGSIRSHVDMGFRYGGEEFTVILPGAGTRQAVIVADRIRQGFSQKRFKVGAGGREDYRTISLGVAIFNPGEDMDSFLERADAAMYRAKKAGGDRVETA